MSDDEIDGLEEALDPVARRIIAFLRQSLSQRDKQIAAQTQQDSARTQQLKEADVPTVDGEQMPLKNRPKTMSAVESDDSTLSPSGNENASLHSYQGTRVRRLRNAKSSGVLNPQDFQAELGLFAQAGVRTQSFEVVRQRCNRVQSHVIVCNRTS